MGVGSFSYLDFSDKDAIRKRAKALFTKNGYIELKRDPQRVFEGQVNYLGQYLLKMPAMSYEEAIYRSLYSRYSSENIPLYGRGMSCTYIMAKEKQDYKLYLEYRNRWPFLVFASLPDVIRISAAVAFSGDLGISGKALNGAKYTINKPKGKAASFNMKDKLIEGLSPISIGIGLNHSDFYGSYSYINIVEKTFNNTCFFDTHFVEDFRADSTICVRVADSVPADYSFYWTNRNYRFYAIFNMPDRFGFTEEINVTLDSTDTEALKQEVLEYYEERTKKGLPLEISGEQFGIGQIEVVHARAESRGYSSDYAKNKVNEDFIKLNPAEKLLRIISFAGMQELIVPDYDKWYKLPFAVNILENSEGSVKMLVFADAVSSHILMIGVEKNKVVTKYDYPTGDAVPFKLTNEYELNAQVNRHKASYGDRLFGMLLYESEYPLTDSPAFLYPDEKKRIYEKVLNLFNYLFKFSDEELTAGLTKKSSDEKLTEVVTDVSKALNEDTFRKIAAKLVNIDVPEEEGSSVDKIKTVSAASIATPRADSRKVRRPR